MTTQDVIDWLAAMPDDNARCEALYEITLKVCEHCGRYWPDNTSPCQCWNDD